MGSSIPRFLQSNGISNDSLVRKFWLRCKVLLGDGEGLRRRIGRLTLWGSNNEWTKKALTPLLSFSSLASPYERGEVEIEKDGKDKSSQRNR